MTPWALTFLLITLLQLWDEKQHNFERGISKIIPAKVGLIWFSSIRGEDLNVKVHDKRRTDDDGRQVMTKAWMAVDQMTLKKHSNVKTYWSLR